MLIGDCARGANQYVWSSETNGLRAGINVSYSHRKRPFDLGLSLYVKNCTGTNILWGWIAAPSMDLQAALVLTDSKGRAVRSKSKSQGKALPTDWNISRLHEKRPRLPLLADNPTYVGRINIFGIFYVPRR